MVEFLDGGVGEGGEQGGEGGVGFRGKDLLEVLGERGEGGGADGEEGLAVDEEAGDGLVELGLELREHNNNNNCKFIGDRSYCY